MFKTLFSATCVTHNVSTPPSLSLSLLLRACVLLCQPFPLSISYDVWDLPFAYYIYGYTICLWSLFNPGQIFYFKAAFIFSLFYIHSIIMWKPHRFPIATNMWQNLSKWILFDEIQLNYDNFNLSHALTFLVIHIRIYRNTKCTNVYQCICVLHSSILLIIYFSSFDWKMPANWNRILWFSTKHFSYVWIHSFIHCYICRKKIIPPKENFHREFIEQSFS